MSPSWSDLPEELLELIFKRPCFDSFDILTCLYVCVSWRSVARRITNCWSNKSGLLSNLFFPDRRHNSIEPYRIKLPMTFDGRNFMSSCRGWILSSAANAEDEFYHDGLQLFNPSTQSIVKLPQPPRDFSKSPFKFILSTGHVGSTREVLLLDMNLKRLASWKPGAAEWESKDNFDSRSVDDIVFYRGRRRGKFRDTKSLTPRSIRSYLVESSSGELLTVTRFMQWGGPSSEYIYKTIGFEVHRRWGRERETSLGNQALFLQLFDSRCVTVSDPAICRPNCIYFVDDSMEGNYTSQGPDFGGFDMESKTIEHFDCTSFNRWFIPHP